LASADAPEAPRPPSRTIEIQVNDLEDLGDLLEDPQVLARILAQVAPAAPATPATPAPPARPRPTVRPRPVTREAARAARADRRLRVVTDTTLAVRPGSRFELNNFGGRVTIATWSRHAVRVQAEHVRRDRVDIGRNEGLLRVVSSSPQGPSQAIEYRLTVPAWLPVSLSGVYNDVTASGLTGGLMVETVRGDIHVKNAAGAIDLRSVEGLVDLSNSKGKIKVSSVNDGVRLMKISGDVQAEAVNGDIQLLDLSSRNVEATTVNGAVLFAGSMFDDGIYRFSTHNGDIAFSMADQANATVNVSTYAGEFEAPFPIRLKNTKPGKRFAFALGNGKAKVELESFQGAIQLFRPGDREVLQRFRESWSESQGERGKGVKWIFKDLEFEFDADDDADEADDADEDAEAAPVGHRKKTR